MKNKTISTHSINCFNETQLCYPDFLFFNSFFELCFFSIVIKLKQITTKKHSNEISKIKIEDHINPQAVIINWTIISPYDLNFQQLLPKKCFKKSVHLILQEIKKMGKSACAKKL